MIEFVKGNFFDFDADIRVNTVNCVGVMGAGVALQFKKQFPDMFEEYLRECNLGNVKIGKPHVWIDNALFRTSPVIINLPTKDHWKKPSEYIYIEKALVWLRDYLSHNAGKTITLPALGCGHGGLDWEKVKRMITEYLSDLDTRILVFEPSSSTNPDLTPKEVAIFQSLGVKKLCPGDIEYPANLKGKAATEIHTIGNTEILQHKLLSIIIDSKATDREKAAILSCIDAIPSSSDFSFLMGYNSSFEIDVIKRLIERGFRVVVLLPYGIFNLKMRKDLSAIWNDEKNVIASICELNQSWNINESIKALKLRLKMSDATLITNYNLDFLNKLDKDFRESTNFIFYLNYWIEKPSFYNSINARQIGRDRTSNLPNMKSVVDLITL